MKQLAIIAALTLLAGCADEETTGSGDCGSDQRAGIQGQVLSPDCEQPIFFADVTLLNELQFEVATTQADEEGIFAFPASAIPEEGTYILTAASGPIRGPARPQPFEFSAGCSPFQTLKLSSQ